MRTQKGITLIALVITIIVMLILVAVTITMAVNGGLFANAQDAGNQTNAAKVEELELSNGAVNVTGVGDGNINSIVDYYVNGTAVPQQ